MIKKFILVYLLSISTLLAGLPPTTSKVSTDPTDVTTFKFRFPNFTGTHSGTTLSLDVNSIAGGGTGQTTKAAAFDALSPMTTGGDIIYGGASGTGTRLANGTNGQYLKSNGGSSAPSWSSLSPTPPTIQKFLSGTGTYTTPAGVVYIKVTMVGGGGGGGGTGNAFGASGSGGGNTTFGALTASGGFGGVFGGTSGGGGGGAGGTSTLGLGVGVNLTGGSGDGGSNTVTPASGGGGGDSAFGGSGSGGGNVVAGGNGATNSGGGGGGGGGGSNFGSGGGGGSGGYIESIITSPSSTYSYAVGAGGALGGAGPSGVAGGAGGSGMILVTEYY